MEKCFITKLPSSVDNDGIVRLGEIPIYFDVDESPSDKSRSFTISMYNQPERTLRIYNGYFTDNTLTQNLGTTLTLPATGGSNYTQTFYVSNTKCTVFIPIRYTSNLSISGQINADSDFVPNTKYIDLEDIRYTNAESIIFNNSNRIDWDIAKVAKYFPNINNFRVCNTNCFGNIGLFSNCISLIYLFLNNTKTTGDISAFSNCTNLKTLQLENTNVSGDISSLSNLTNLVYLNISRNNVTGDISVIINNMSKLKTLSISTKIAATDAQIKTLQDRGVTVIRK